MNECDDDETPARILYALNSLYIKVSLKLLYLFKIYTCIYTLPRLLSSSSVFLLLRNNLKAREGCSILRVGVSCFQIQKRKRKKRFAAFFLKMHLGLPTLIYCTRERVFLFFRKENEKVSLTRVSLLSVVCGNVR